MDTFNVSGCGRLRRLGFWQGRRAVVFCAVALLVFLVCPFQDAEAAVFDGDYLHFRLPDGWKCEFEDDVFVCQPPLPKGRKFPSIIILTAKIASAEDTLPGYITHLRKNLSKGSKGPSLVEGPRINNGLGKVSWVEATHLGSEIPGFYTTYLTTTWDGLSILVTFSAHRSVFPEFRKWIAPCIQACR